MLTFAAQKSIFTVCRGLNDSETNRRVMDDASIGVFLERRRRQGQRAMEPEADWPMSDADGREKQSLSSLVLLLKRRGDAYQMTVSLLQIRSNDFWSSKCSAAPSTSFLRQPV
eukprot:scpid17937/ scgid31651/ 